MARPTAPPPIEATVPQVRRLVLAKQRLAGRSRSSAAAIEALVRELAYVQVDPVSVVAPAHLVTFWSRLDGFRPAELDRLLWKERRLFQHHAHALSIVPTDDYSLHYSLMRRYPESLSSAWGSWRAHARRWIPAHRGLRASVLRELRHGPKVVGEFAGHAASRRPSDGWGSGSDVSAMLFHLWMAGEVMIVGQRGTQNLWGLAREFLPESTDRTVLSQAAVELAGAQRALRAQGVATRRDITFYFPRGRYLDLPGTLARLEADGRIRRVRIEGAAGLDVLYVHTDDLDLLEAQRDAEWEPRLSLLSPFDSAICGRERTERLLGFEYLHENYVPPAKRRFGVWVMPILWGDRFVGRIDPKLDRTTSTLRINAVFAEADAPATSELVASLERRIRELAEFVGARRVEYSSRFPGAWKRLRR